MRPPDIVVVDPVSDLGTGVVEIEKQGLVQQFIAHPAIEALDEAVLHWLSRCDEVPVDDCVLAPGEHGIAGELGAMVGHDHSWLAASLDDRRQFAGNAPSRDRRIRNSSEALFGDIIDDVEDTEASSVGELVVNEVQRPACIRPRLDHDRRPRPHSLAAGPPLADGKPFLSDKANKSG